MFSKVGSGTNFLASSVQHIKANYLWIDSSVLSMFIEILGSFIVRLNIESYIETGNQHNSDTKFFFYKHIC